MHELLRGGRAVEADDEVVPAVVQGLRAHFAPCEKEGAPVCYAADDAAVCEDEVAGGSGDSEERERGVSGGEWLGKRRGMGRGRGVKNTL